MVTRRNLISGAGAFAVAALAAPAVTRATEVAASAQFDPANLSPEMKKMHAVRFATLDQEAYSNFVAGFKNFHGVAYVPPFNKERFEHTQAFLRARGVTTGETDLSYEESFDLLLQDPVYAAWTRLYMSNQQQMWHRTQRFFHRHADRYLDAMEKTDRTGPGSLELDPGLDLPRYTRYEIHTQPGGYVGDPFAGWIYHYALSRGFFQGLSDHDEIFLAIANNHPIPRNGRVKRMLDLGCGTGQSTTAIKLRFPEAEVWGIDAGGPMVRYAHHRAHGMGLDVKFAQRLAESTGFPNGYFDIVTDHIMFHEVTADAAQKIVAETHRILRPGGVFHHVDIATRGHPKAPTPRTVIEKAFAWMGHRHNMEPWFFEYMHSDFPAVLRQNGFDVNLDIPANRRGAYPGVMGTKV
jgi:ubiquinone/menaquinone biosynthesis C-methylase UbiE